MNFVKLSELIDSSFTIREVKPYVYKKWSPEEKKMLSSDKWQEGYQKKYPITTDKGLLEVGAGQLGNMLQEAMEHGKADLIGKTFSVKSNGKTGMEVRYFLNLVREPQPEKEVDPSSGEPPTNLYDDVAF